MSKSDPPFVVLQDSQIGGVIAVDVFALLSSAALVSVAFRVLWLAVLRQISPATYNPKEYVFFNTQLGYYAICLLVGNLLTDVSGLIGLRWLLDRQITKGSLCTVQAILMQIGNWAIAYFTVAIGIHTFNTLVMRVRQSAIVSTVSITVGWISAGLLAAGPFIHPQQSQAGPLYGIGISELSCGIRDVHPKAQFFYHLLPIFFASVLSAILYSVIFLVLRGTLNIKGGVRFTLDPYERWSLVRVAENYHRFVARIARSMLWYPFAYIALLIPYSVARLLSMSGYKVPFQVTVFAFTCWFMLGIVNVALLYNTFRVLGPALDPPSQKETSMGYDSSKGHWSPEGSYPTPSYRSPTIASFGPRFSPQSTVRPLPPIHQETSASVQSYYSYLSSSSVSIGREISPVNEFALQLSITPLKAPAQKRASATARSIDLHSRQGSNESIGLPAAPRRTRSPVLHHPSVEQMRVVQGTWSPVDRAELSMQRPTSVQTFGKRDSESLRYSYESDSQYGPTDWEFLSPDKNGRLSTLNTNLSPVSPGYSLRPLPITSRHGRSLSAVPTPSSAPTGRQRSVLASRHRSIGDTADVNQQRVN